MNRVLELFVLTDNLSASRIGNAGPALASTDFDDIVTSLQESTSRDLRLTRLLEAPGGHAVRRK